MRGVYKILTYCSLIVIVLSSCGSSNHVVNNHLFQKRKYRKGWHLNTPDLFAQKRNSVVDSNVTLNNDAPNKLNIHETVLTDREVKEDKSTDQLVAVNDLVDKKDMNQNPISINFKKSDCSAVSVLKSDTKVKREKNYQALSQSSPKNYNPKRDYLFAWLFTILALGLLTLLIYFNLFSSFSYGNVTILIILGTLTIIAYVFMFIFLIRTGQGLIVEGREGAWFYSIVWLHIIIGSLFSLILMPIPIWIASQKLKGGKNKSSKKKEKPKLNRTKKEVLPGLLVGLAGLVAILIISIIISN